MSRFRSTPPSREPPTVEVLDSPGELPTTLQSVRPNMPADVGRYTISVDPALDQSPRHNSVLRPMPSSGLTASMAPSKRAEEAMFQLNETEMWREHRQGLLSEAEGERFTLRIGWAAGLRRMLVVMAVAAVIVTTTVAPASQSSQPVTWRAKRPASSTSPPTRSIPRARIRTRALASIVSARRPETRCKLDSVGTEAVRANCWIPQP